MYGKSFEAFLKANRCEIPALKGRTARGSATNLDTVKI
jgi:hypothetical protein